MRALRIYAGPGARALLEREGLQASRVKLVPGAAGGPKGLILGPLDRFIFGEWLAQTDHEVQLVGASIGAWRMATACLDGPVAALDRLERDYIHQDYVVAPGQKRPSADQISAVFGRNLRDFYGHRLGEILNHPRYRLHIVASRGRRLLRREHPVLTPLGYLGAFAGNVVQRRLMGQLLERSVFSAGQGGLPFGTADYPTQALTLTGDNFHAALQASCAIPFVLRSVSGIAGAPPGAYWDGGLTDYHLHLDYRPLCGDDGLVLYPHFQQAVVPGWLDKGLKWRHGATAFLDNMVLLAPDPQWVGTLPNGKLPDRSDFTRYTGDLAGRVTAWTGAVSQARQLADEFAAWLDKPDMGRVQPL